MSGLLINIVLYALIIYMVLQIFTTGKRQKKNKILIDCVNSIKDEDTFFEKTNNMIDTIHDPEFENKAKVIKLWGIAYHKRYEMFDETLNAIDPTMLIAVKKGKPSIDLNEDSFFYMYLGIPNMLYGDGKEEFRKELIDKVNTVDEQLQGQLVRQISLEINKYYDKEGDGGLAFYEQLLNGDYGQYTYSRTMIGLYKSIVNVMSARIYLDNGDTEKYQEAEGMLRDFNQTGVGHRWMQCMDMSIEEEKPEEVEDGNEQFKITSDSSKNADVIDAEVSDEKPAEEESEKTETENKSSDEILDAEVKETEDKKEDKE